MMRADVAAGKHLFEMPKERRVNGERVFETAVGRTLLDHQNLAVALEDGRLDLADLFVEKNADVLLAVKNLLSGLSHADRAE